jgi:hypothetical protein
MVQKSDKNVSLTDRLYGWLTQIVGQPIFVSVSLLVITFVGAFLRIYKLGEWSFWGDEMFTVGGYEDGFNYNLIRQSLSLALIQFFTSVNGVNEWNARIVPAIIGIITIPVLFFMVRKLFNTPAALLAALLLSFSPWHLYWSQNARFYTALLLFYSLAIFFFYLGTEHDNPWYLLICLIFLGLAAKERLLALFFLPVALIYLLLLQVLSFEKPKGWHYRNLIIFILPGLLGGLLFAGPYLLNLSGWFAGFGFANNNPLWLAGGFAFYVGLPVVCLGSVGGLYLVWQKNRAGLLLCVSAMVPLLLLLAVSPFHYTANRYIFISLTSWLLLAAVSLATLIKKSVGSIKLLALGTLLILLVSSASDNALYYLYQNGNRDNWKAAFAYVHQHQQPEDLVASGDYHIANYYLPAEVIAFSQLDLDEMETQDRRIWFVEDMASIQKFPELHAWLTRNTQLVSVHDVNFQARNFSMRIYLYNPVLRLGVGGSENGR